MRLSLLAALACLLITATGFRNPPGSAERFIEMGDIAQSERDQAKALEYYGRAIALAPDKSEFYLTRGFLLLKLDRFDEALRDFSTIIALDPTNPRGYFTRGMAYDRSGRSREADLDFATACRMGDSNGCGFKGKTGD